MPYILIFSAAITLISVFFIRKRVLKNKITPVPKKTNSTGIEKQVREVGKVEATPKIEGSQIRIVDGKITISPSKKPEIVTQNQEEQTKVKFIGYNPINVFAQSEPFNFPYVVMPNLNSVIKFPKKGRTGRKGYKEEEFKSYLVRYFTSSLKLFDDRFILVKNSSKPFEPDFTLIDEKNGLNLFIDVEIDEPYEGLNDISKRKATHYQYSDINRNNSFKNRGWIVIRFAEIQIHQQPISCCKYIADVIRSINEKFDLPEPLLQAKQLQPVKQWTHEEALAWSKEKYREKYLGILSFGYTEAELSNENIAESEIDTQVEAIVKEEPIANIQRSELNEKNSIEEKILEAVKIKGFLSIAHSGEKTIVRPSEIREKKLFGYCYVKNETTSFELQKIKSVTLKQNYFSLKVAAPSIGIESVRNAVNSAIQYKKYIRMKYTRAAWTNMTVDEETGELIIVDKVEAEESIRTINNIQMATEALDEEHINYYHLDNNYINAYCNKRKEKRTFRFDRIGEIEILDI